MFVVTRMYAVILGLVVMSIIHVTNVFVPEDLPLHLDTPD